jgi:hypothetical protein
VNLQNILNYIDDLIEIAKKEQKYAVHKSDSEYSYWQGYEESLLMVKVRIEKKIRDRKEKNKNSAASQKKQD